MFSSVCKVDILPQFSSGQNDDQQYRNEIAESTMVSCGIKLLNNQLIVMSVQGDSLRSEVRKDVPLDGVPSTSRIPREQKKRETISSM